MSNDLVVSNSLIPSNHEIQCFQIMAKQSASSGFFKSIGGEAQIMTILLLARELNIPPMLAISGGIWNIKGKVEISARMMNTLIRRNGHSLQVKESTDSICIIQGKRKDNGDTFEASFSIKEAQQAGLIRKNHDGSDGIWMKYPKDMLFARALSRLARQLFSDCIGNAYVEGEIRDAVEPEKLQESSDVQVIEESPKDEITDPQMIEYIESFGEDKQFFLELMADKTLSKKLSRIEFVKYCMKHSEKAKQQVENYKEYKKQVA